MPTELVLFPSVARSDISPVSVRSVREVVRNQSQSEIGPVSHRTDDPPFRGSGPSDRGRSRSDSLARWRNSQRHAEANADWTAIELLWLWVTTSDDQQRVLCTAIHDHPKGCHARHGHPKP